MKIDTRIKNLVNLHFTIADSSPGNILSFSPTWTTPPQILPDTAAPVFWRLNTLDIGMRRGAAISRIGGTSLSVMVP